MDAAQLTNFEPQMQMGTEQQQQQNTGVIIPGQGQRMPPGQRTLLPTEEVLKGMIEPRPPSRGQDATNRQQSVAVAPTESASSFVSECKTFLENELTFNTIVDKRRCDGVKCLLDKLSLHWSCESNNLYWTSLFSNYLQEMKRINKENENNPNTGYVLVQPDPNNRRQWYLAHPKPMTRMWVLHAEFCPRDATTPQQQCPALIFITDEQCAIVTNAKFRPAFERNIPLWKAVVKKMMASYAPPSIFVVLPAEHTFAFLMWFHVGCTLKRPESAIETYLQEFKPSAGGTPATGHTLYQMKTVDSLIPQGPEQLAIIGEQYKRQRQETLANKDGSMEFTSILDDEPM